MPSQMLVSVPILMYGIGHAMLATVQAPIVNKYADPTNKDMIPQIFSWLKIFEGMSLSVVIYTNGHIRQITGSYLGVSLLIIVLAFLGILVSLRLHFNSRLLFSVTESGEVVRINSISKPEKPQEEATNEDLLQSEQGPGTVSTFSGNSEVVDKEMSISSMDLERNDSTGSESNLLEPSP